MKLDSLIQLIRKGFEKPLPGVAAHRMVVPLSRALNGVEEARSSGDFRESAVVALFREKNDEAHLVLMQRPAYDGVHSGQISFPGGKREDFDQDLRSTALREMTEEIGIREDEVQLLGALTEIFIPPSKFIVQPWIAFTHRELKFLPDPVEVSEVLEFPWRKFQEGASLQEVDMNIRGFKAKVPAFVIDDKVIWGATAMMIAEIIRITE